MLLLIQHHNDTLSDLFGYLGNSSAGLDAPDGMVVFGFGRRRGAQPCLSDPAARFTISLLDFGVRADVDHRRISDTAFRILETRK